MYKKDINANLKNIRGYIESGENLAVIGGEFECLADTLHEEGQHYEIIEAYKNLKKKLDQPTPLFCFSLAYALNEADHKDDAEIIYDYLLENDSDNSSILNNLSNLKKRKNNVQEAFSLIERAYNISPDDEIVVKNYESLLQTIQEKEEKERFFKSAVKSLEKENSFVLEKLKNFLSAARKDENYRDGIIPIPRWKFMPFMKTDEQKADSLKNQWLDKGYLVNTGKRDGHNVIVYEINTLLEHHIEDIKSKTVNPSWIKGIERLEVEKLEELEYYDNLKKIERINKKFKFIVKRDFEELTINYVFKNNKTVLVLSGSLIETLLIYYLTKKKVKNIEYRVGEKKISKGLYEASLSDLIAFIEQERVLEGTFVHLANLSRIYRNFIHPGREIKSSGGLDNSKADLCYLSAKELLKAVL